VRRVFEVLLSDINGKRRDAYKQIAIKNGTTLQAVETLAGEKAMQKTPSGQYIKDASDNWVQK